MTTKQIYIIGGVSVLLITAGTVWYLKIHRPDKNTADVQEPANSGGNTGSNTPKKSSAPKKQAPSSSGTIISPVLVPLAAALGVKVSSDNTVTVPFNASRNYITFYTNSRFTVGNAAKKAMYKGSWANAGKSLTPDGAKAITSESVWANIGKLRTT